MKRFQLVVLLGLFSLAIAQNPIVFKDRAKNPHIVIQGNDGNLDYAEGLFELTGNVQIKRIDEKSNVETLMTSAKATGKITKSGGKTEIDKVRMLGGIHLTQSGKSFSTILNGETGEYDLKGDQREVNINGSVKISFEGDSTQKTSNTHSNMSATARSATVDFSTTHDANKKDVTEVQSAVIRGPIEFGGVQLVKDDTGEHIKRVIAKADEMRYTISGEEKKPEIRLMGNIEFHEVDAGDNGAMVEGGKLLVLVLNDKNEIIKLKFSAAAGTQIKSTYSKTTVKPAAGKAQKGGA